MRFAFAVAAVLAVVSTASGAAGGKKVQCWNDKDGHRMCGDRVPPEYAGQKRDVMEGGRVVDTVKAARTPEEIAEEKRQKEAADAAARQADYDRDLLQTYRSSKDMETMRDERLTMIDSRITAAQKNTESTDKSLADLKARAEALTKDGKPVDDKLAKQIKTYEKAQQNNQLALDRAKKERDEVEAKFNADIARYNQLRGLPPPKPAAPAPATPAAASGAAPAAGTAPAAKPAADPAPAAADPKKKG